MPAKSKKKPAKAAKSTTKKAVRPAKSAKPAPKKTARTAKAAAKPQAKSASRKPTGRKRGRPTLSPHGLVGSNISLRMPPELYGYLKKTGKNWQTRVVRHLMAEMDRKAAWMKG